MYPSRIRFSIAIVMLAATAAVGFILISPAMGEAQIAKQNLDQVKIQLEQHDAIVKAFENLNKELNNNAKEVERAEIAIPLGKDKPSDLPELLATIEALARQEAGGIFLQSLSVGEPEAYGPSPANLEGSILKSRFITTQGLASYETLGNFLLAMSKSLRILNPESLAITVQPGETLLTFNLSFRAFVQGK